MKKLKLVCVVALFFVLLAVGLSACNGATRTEAKKAVYDIVAVYDAEAQTLTCRQEVMYTNNTGVELSDVIFNLSPNGFREDAAVAAVAEKDRATSYFAGESYGGIEFSSVLLEGVATEYAVGGEDANALIVPFVEPLVPGATAMIAMEYVVTVPTCAARFGVNKNTINLNNFYPVAAVWENNQFCTNPYYSYGDPFYAEAADFYLTFSAPQEYTVAVSGDVVERYVESGMATIEVEAENFRDISLVLGKDFAVLSDRASGVDVNYYYVSDSSPEASLAVAVSALETFSAAFGSFAFPSFNVVETELLSGGMEYCGQVLIAPGAIGTEREDVIVHETAHQWWYCAVGSNQIANAWQDEGLTEFSTALYRKLNDDDNGYVRLTTAAFEGYTAYRRALSATTTEMTKPLGEYATSGEYVMIAYRKGELLFQSLYEIMGQKDFLKALSSYYKNYKFGVATPQNLIDSFSDARKPTAPVFEAYLNGKVKL